MNRYAQDTRSPRRKGRRSHNPMPLLGGDGPPGGFPEGNFTSWPGPEMSRFIRATARAYDLAKTHAQVHRIHGRAMNKIRAWERQEHRRLAPDWAYVVTFGYTDALRRLGPSAAEIRDAAIKAAGGGGRPGPARRRKNPVEDRAPRVVYAPINAAWTILYGNSLLDIDGQRFWPAKKDLVWALRVKGLRLDKYNRVTVE